MDNIFTEDFKKLGLGDYESQVYSVLLKNSPARAAFIAKECKLSRSSVYTTLSSLISKGLVSTTHTNEVKLFIANGYESLEQLLETREAELKNQFSTLNSLKDSLLLFNNSNSKLPQIMFFEGQAGLKKIYLSMLREAPENSTLYLLRDEFIWEPDWQFVFEEKWHTRIKRLKIEKDIKTKLLVNDSKVERSKSKLYESRRDLNFRFLPKSQSMKNFAIYILGDMINIMSFEKNNLVGIQILNSNMAQNFVSSFEAMWSASKK